MRLSFSAKISDHKALRVYVSGYSALVSGQRCVSSTCPPANLRQRQQRLFLSIFTCALGSICKNPKLSPPVAARLPLRALATSCDSFVFIWPNFPGRGQTVFVFAGTTVSVTITQLCPGSSEAIRVCVVTHQCV